ncbi:hypothetical protein AVEN_101555-1 [Araneus ventricosus]|uniref:Uncharacterized protein n=1 Tax=Araneus ventricosus TaxID=182803 RepID=A0A4Y2CLJ9_ARAVE|nr:hypothetical protein AVEN_101555-1 [Araneus ventricosus]
MVHFDSLWNYSFLFSVISNKSSHGTWERPWQPNCKVWISKPEINLVFLTSPFEVTLGLLWERPSNFEPRLYGEDDTEAGPTLFKLPHHTSG